MPAGGRPKGARNKISVELKTMIEGALQDAGGREYLAEQATKNPAAFMALVGKLIPRDLNVSGELRHSLENLIVGALTQSDERQSSHSH